MAQATAVRRMPMGEPPIAQFLFADPRLAWFWLVVRLYAGYQWLSAGMEKLGSPVWTGSKAGTAIAGFVAGALPKVAGGHPDVAAWYAGFLQAFVLPHAALWSWLIVFGELAVGVGLILGLFTGIAAFFGGLLNANYLLAGTVSTNPMLFILATWLVLAWRVAGYYGLDYWVLPAVGVPGGTGGLFRGRHRSTAEPVPDGIPAHSI